MKESLFFEMGRINIKHKERREKRGNLLEVAPIPLVGNPVN
jgi:hypothetical protein